MQFNDNGESKVEISIGTQIISPKNGFKYLGSMIQRNGEIDGYIIQWPLHQVKLAKIETSEVLSDKKVPLNLRGNSTG